MIFVCEVRCIADVSSASLSSEQIEGLCGNQCLNIRELIYANGKVVSG